MKIVVKDVTGEIYESPDLTKDRLAQEIRAAYRCETEEEVADFYRVLVNSMRQWNSMGTITVNVGSLEKQENITLPTSRLIYVRVIDPILEWEDENDERTFLDDPRFWS